MDLNGFGYVIKKLGQNLLTEHEIAQAFAAAAGGGEKLSLKQFSGAFTAARPPHNFQVEGLRRVRDWMYRSGFSSEQAFE